MRLVDHRKLARLMVIQGVSHRELAQAAGWRGHSYVSRMVRGEVDTCKPEPAVRIARYLGVGTDDLFVTRTSTDWTLRKGSTTVALTRSTPPKEVWMRLVDHRKLARLMVIQGVSHRELAQAAGWRGHSYVSRMVRGEVDTCKPEPAVRIARYLGVGTDDLFVTRTSTDTGCGGKRSAA